MTRKFFNEQFAALVSAYTISHKLSDESQDVYWTMLEGIPEKAFAEGVKKCLGECKFFPTIAELGDASLPAKTKLGPYNPYGESIYTLTWQDQVRELEEEDELPPPEVTKLIKGLVK